ncbi:hypothetical protein P8452_38855 [Trifolium repens]|nr:hypothetical protein P8452_38855 [Trifolium repens]
MNEMNGKFVGRKPLFVEERKAQLQMMHHNSNQGFRYMDNYQNGMDSSGVPHGLAGPMLPITFDGSRVTAPIDNQCPGSSSFGK